MIDAQLARGEESDGTADAEFLEYIYSDAAYDYIASDEEEGGDPRAGR